MGDKLRELLQPAFREVPAREANQAIARARREKGGGDPDDEDAPALRSYEVILNSWQAFAEEQLPKLVYHLESVGAHLPQCKGVIISAFLGERLFFVEARELVAKACALLSVSPDELVAKYGTGERRTAVREGEPLLLPGPKGRN
ncbi:MAG TPA: STAUR_1299 family protein [Myxococcales bacterium]|nr:STAUR_1299 family protein [Myxococcales bacterium]